MADGSKIEWTDASWNPVVGCSILSPGCTNCYAMGMAARIEAMTAALKAKGGTGAPHYDGTTRRVKGKAVWTGKLALAPEAILTEPLAWKRPRKIFVNSMGDLFHEDVPDEWIDKVFAVMALAPQHAFQLLTKRSARMRAYMKGIQSKIPFLGRMPLERIHLEAAAHMEGDGGFMDTLKDHGNVYSLYLDAPWPLPNVWLGVSAEDQTRADERIPDLLQTPAAVRWVSAEPLLGPIDFNRISLGTSAATFVDDPTIDKVKFTVSALRGAKSITWPPLDWIVIGGESGEAARPMHPDWARTIRDQCSAAGVAFFFKQWGSWGSATPRPSGTSGRFSIANAPPYSDFMPAMMIQVDAYPRQLDLFGGASVREFIGKRRAGRLLDGVEHNGLPAVNA